MDLFGKIHGALQGTFQVTGTSRDKETHDLCVALRFVQRDFAIEFPANFPDGEATLSTEDKDIPISLGKPVKETLTIRNLVKRKMTRQIIQMM